MFHGQSRTEDNAFDSDSLESLMQPKQLLRELAINILPLSTLVRTTIAHRKGQLENVAATYIGTSLLELAKIAVYAGAVLGAYHLLK